VDDVRLKKLYAVVLGLTIACIGVLAATKIADPDTMQYLASGRTMLEHGLEDGCVFTYASDQCQVVYPQWLFHVATYAVYRAGGWDALVWFQIAIAAGVFGIIVVRQRRTPSHPLTIAAVSLLAAMVARERFILRADLFALLPAVLLYYSLDAYWDPSTTPAARRALLPALACIQAVWANTHGSFYIGFVLLAAFLAESALSRRPGIRPVLEAAGTIVLASFLNPYGLKSFLQPLRFMLGGARTAPQLEFVSPFAPADLTHLTVIAYKAWLVVVVALLVVSMRKLSARVLLILAPLAYLSATGMRYMALFAVFGAVLLPPFAEDLRLLIARRIARRRDTTRETAIALGVSAVLVATIGGVAFAAVTDRIYRFDAISRRTGFGVSDLVYPIAAAEFIERNNLPGNLFNDYSIGTYLNWRLFPARKTFIDGHTYTPDRLAYYRQVMAGSVPYQQVVDQYHVNVFILSHKSSEARDLIAKLYRDEHWALVYFDEVAVVFLKTTTENEALIARYRVDLAATEKAGPAPLQNVREPSDAYLGHTDRGLALSGLGLTAEAATELAAAAQENPRSFVTLTALCLQLAQSGDMARAVDACERSVEVRSGYAPGRFWLGILYLRQKRTAEGIAQLEAALHVNATFPLAHYNLGAAFENQGDKRRALEQYRQELAINPSYPPAQKGVKRLGS
jgi:tetratricopeptide (TPR) repeat protein